MKLYKYKSIKNGFENSLSSLKENYLWLANVDSLNDPMDSIIYYDQEKQIEILQEYYENNEETVIVGLLEKLPVPGLVDALKLLPKEQIKYMISLFKHNDNEVIKNAIIAQGGTEYHSDVLFMQLSKINDIFESKETELTDALLPILDFNRTYRDKLKIFSLSERFDVSSMWGLYADNNRGFCIEYDFSKVTDKDILKNLRQVKYIDERTALSYKDLFIGSLLSQDPKTNMTELLEEQILTKDASWSAEREWRIVMTNVPNKLYIDIVSAIYIDESIKDTQEGKQLIQLANGRKWNILIRSLKLDKTGYSYTKY